MQIIENIKDYFGKKRVAKLLNLSKNRTKKFYNLNEAKSVGLLMVVENESEYKQLQQFIKELKGDIGVRKVKALVYYPKEDEPFYLQSKLSFDFFTPKDLNWKREPQKDVCQTFVEEQFDVLIDLSSSYCIPLRQLLAQSKSLFKVGRYTPENEPFYDFMISSEQDSFQTFTKEVVKYLTTINAK